MAAVTPHGSMQRAHPGAHTSVRRLVANLKTAEEQPGAERHHEAIHRLRSQQHIAFILREDHR
jgi:hypothetical protein